MDTSVTETRVNPTMVRLLRNTRHWTQDELSVVSGLSLRTVQRAEQDGNVSVATLKSLASAFQVSAEELEAKKSGKRSTQWGPVVGLWCGYGGALLGGLMSLGGQLRSLDAGEMTASEIGVTAGVTGAAVGLTCALIGLMHRRSTENR